MMSRPIEEIVKPGALVPCGYEHTPNFADWLQNEFFFETTRYGRLEKGEAVKLTENLIDHLRIRIEVGSTLISGISYALCVFKSRKGYIPAVETKIVQEVNPHSQIYHVLTADIPGNKKRNYPLGHFSETESTVSKVTIGSQDLEIHIANAMNEISNGQGRRSNSDPMVGQRRIIYTR